jgi:signal peptidase I
MKKAKNIIKIVLSLFIFTLIPAVVFTLITSHSAVLGGIRSYDVMTGSMEPVLHVGSMVFTKPAATYQVGDVITFKRGNITVTHRIFGTKDNMFITKGDANKSQDPQLVSKSQIIGKNFFVIPNIGKITGFVKTVPGFLLVIVLPLMVYIGFEINTIKEEYKKEIRKQVLSEFHMINV